MGPGGEQAARAGRPAGLDIRIGGLVKRQRQEAIRRIVKSGKVASQSDLVESLRSEGFEVSQTTVSRDLSELGLMRLREAGQGARYVEPGSAGSADDSALRLSLIHISEPTR